MVYLGKGYIGFIVGVKGGRLNGRHCMMTTAGGKDSTTVVGGMARIGRGTLMGSVLMGFGAKLKIGSREKTVE